MLSIYLSKENRSNYQRLYKKRKNNKFKTENWNLGTKEKSNQRNHDENIRLK